MAKKNRPDYYKILGLTVKANDKQIKNAAVKMLHKYREDIYKGGDANARQEEILEARDTLLDFDKRKKYDQYWLETFAPQHGGSEEQRQAVRSNGTVKVKQQVKEETLSNDNGSALATVKTNKFFKFFDKLQLPKREVNDRYPFLFKIYNWKTDGMIFLLTGIIIPLIALFVLAFAAHMGQDYEGVSSSLRDPLITMGSGKDKVDASPMIFFAINIVSNLIGFLIFWQRDSRVLTKSGFVIFYWYIFIVNFIMIIASIILGLAIPKPDDGQITDSPAYQIASLWFQIVAEIIVIYLAMVQTKDLKKRILMTLKQNWKMLLIVMIIAGVLLFVFIEFVMPNIFIKVPAIHNTNSANEQSLEKGLKSGSTGYRVGYAITLFIMTILVAPLTEELATRHAIFTGTSNRTLALFTAALYFAMLHVQGGDVEHIFTYFIGGLFLSGVFSISRGNVTYDTGTHMVYNFISFVIICAQDMHA